MTSGHKATLFSARHYRAYPELFLKVEVIGDPEEGEPKPAVVDEEESDNADDWKKG